MGELMEQPVSTALIGGSVSNAVSVVGVNPSTGLFPYPRTASVTWSQRRAPARAHVRWRALRLGLFGAAACLAAGSLGF